MTRADRHFSWVGEGMEKYFFAITFVLAEWKRNPLTRLVVCFRIPMLQISQHHCGHILGILSTDPSTSQTKKKMREKSMMPACVLQLHHHKYLALYLNSLLKTAYIIIKLCLRANRTSSSQSLGSSDEFIGWFYQCLKVCWCSWCRHTRQYVTNAHRICYVNLESLELNALPVVVTSVGNDK